MGLEESAARSSIAVSGPLGFELSSLQLRRMERAPFFMLCWCVGAGEGDCAAVVGPGGAAASLDE